MVTTSKKPKRLAEGTAKERQRLSENPRQRSLDHPLLTTLFSGKTVLLTKILREHLCPLHPTSDAFTLIFKRLFPHLPHSGWVCYPTISSICSFLKMFASLSWRQLLKLKTRGLHPVRFVVKETYLTILNTLFSHTEYPTISRMPLIYLLLTSLFV